MTISGSNIPSPPRCQFTCSRLWVWVPWRHLSFLWVNYVFKTLPKCWSLDGYVLAELALLPKLEVSNSVPAFHPSCSPGVGAGGRPPKSSHTPTRHYGARERREDCFFLLFWISQCAGTSTNYFSNWNVCVCVCVNFHLKVSKGWPIYKGKYILNQSNFLAEGGWQWLPHPHPQRWPSLLLPGA